MCAPVGMQATVDEEIQCDKALSNCSSELECKESVRFFFEYRNTLLNHINCEILHI